jgi:hypothetical protein
MDDTPQPEGVKVPEDNYSRTEAPSARVPASRNNKANLTQATNAVPPVMTSAQAEHDAVLHNHTPASTGQVRFARITRWVKRLIAFFIAFGNLIEPVRYGLFSGVGTIVSGLLIYIAHLRFGWSKETGAILELWAATFFFLLETIARWSKAKYKYQEIRGIGDRLLDLYHVVPDQLDSHVHGAVVKKIESLVDLSSGRGSDCTYPEQIEIASNLTEGATKRFWATSTDKPSVLWAEGIHYFKNQENLDMSDSSETDPPPKARLVLLSFEELFEDYSDSVSSQGFNKFVAWHARNDFPLRFYLVPHTEDLREKISRTVDDSDPLKDFLIKDDAFIYGRIETLGGSGVRLKFISHETDAGLVKFNSYKVLFTNLWEQSDPRERVLGKLDFERGRRAREEQVRKDYKSEFIDAPSGEAFLKEMLRRISETKQTLHAVDIADKKSSISNWSFQTEYKQWLGACIEATKKGTVDAKRIFIVRAFGVLAEDFELQQVLRQQLEAGFEIVLIDEDEVTSGNLHVDDFLLIDDDLGFTLGPDSSKTFVQDSLEFSKNLIPKNSLQTYRDKFDELLQYGQHFKGKNDIAQLETFLKQLMPRST